MHEYDIIKGRILLDDTVVLKDRETGEGYILSGLYIKDLEPEGCSSVSDACYVDITLHAEVSKEDKERG